MENRAKIWQTRLKKKDRLALFPAFQLCFYIIAFKENRLQPLNARSFPTTRQHRSGLLKSFVRLMILSLRNFDLGTEHACQRLYPLIGRLN